MRRSGVEAARYMAGLARDNASGVKGYCLRTCRLAWDLPGGSPSAIAEWNSIPQKYKHLDPDKAPVGAPHFFRVGKYGHICLQAEHEGYVWSTDAPVVNKVGLVDILWFKKRWRAEYLGWTNYLRGHVLPLGAEAPK